MQTVPIILRHVYDPSLLGHRTYSVYLVRKHNDFTICITSKCGKYKWSSSWPWYHQHEIVPALPSRSYLLHPRCIQHIDCACVSRYMAVSWAMGQNIMEITNWTLLTASSESPLCHVIRLIYVSIHFIDHTTADSQTFHWFVSDWSSQLIIKFGPETLNHITE